MAEHAANFTFTSQNKPSIFEVIAQKSLNDALHPALQKVALFLATKYPNEFSWLNDYYEETYLALSSLIQYHYLQQYDGTFAENFYGLKRVLAKDGEHITNFYRFTSLVYVTIIPYVKRKLEERLTIYRLQNAEDTLGKGAQKYIKKLLLFCHASFEVTWGTWILVNYIKYMANNTQTQLPTLELLGLKLIYSNEAVQQNSLWGALFRGQFNIPDFSVDLMRNGLTSILEVTAFFMQFLNAWNSQMTNYDITSLPQINPPRLDTKYKKYLGKCPICLLSWKIPTVLPVSGYVFCFSCILKYLQLHQKCPVTNLPAKPLDIIRLYDSDSF